jgi:hypothetical protein
MNSHYQKGELVPCEARFSNPLTDELVDPNTVIFKVQDPDEIETSYTYGVDTEVIKDSVGVYHLDVLANKSGTWFYRYESPGQAANESWFYVERSEF